MVNERKHFFKGCTRPFVRPTGMEIFHCFQVLLSKIPASFFSSGKPAFLWFVRFNAYRRKRASLDLFVRVFGAGAGRTTACPRRTVESRKKAKGRSPSVTRCLVVFFSSSTTSENSCSLVIKFMNRDPMMVIILVVFTCLFASLWRRKRWVGPFWMFLLIKTPWKIINGYFLGTDSPSFSFAGVLRELWTADTTLALLLLSFLLRPPCWISVLCRFSHRLATRSIISITSFANVLLWTLYHLLNYTLYSLFSDHFLISHYLIVMVKSYPSVLVFFYLPPDGALSRPGSFSEGCLTWHYFLGIYRYYSKETLKNCFM